MTNDPNADQIMLDLRRRGVIPPAPTPAPDQKHRVVETFAYVLSGACLGLAVIIGALIVIELVTP